MYAQLTYYLIFYLYQEIKPFETKAVMKANFVGRVESNHSAFIRIKTNKEEEHTSSSELLILPVEVEVSSGMPSQSFVFF